MFRSFPSYKASHFFRGLTWRPRWTQVPKSPGRALGRPWEYRPGHSASGGAIHRFSLGPGGESATEGLAGINAESMAIDGPKLKMALKLQLIPDWW